jgi:hypothetical protein
LLLPLLVISQPRSDLILLPSGLFIFIWAGRDTSWERIAFSQEVYWVKLVIIKNEIK